MGLTDEALAEAYAKRCKKCRYRGPKGGAYQCGYLLIEGHMRGCGIENCKRYKPGKRREASQPPNSPIQRQRRTIQKRKASRSALGRVIDMWQIKHNMTNRELATLLGINVATISKWRNGSKPQEPQIVKLGQVLGIDVRDIVENG